MTLVAGECEGRLEGFAVWQIGDRPSEKSVEIAGRAQRKDVLAD